MRPRWGLLWLLGAAASCLMQGSLGSPRTIRLTYSSATEACPGLPPFTAEGYVDNQLITRYESHTEKLHPRVDWINKLEKEDSGFYNRYTSILQKDQKDFQKNVQMLQKCYNQSGGFHIIQMMVFCEVGEDGNSTGHWQYNYDGRLFLGYEMKTGIWAAADEAQGIKREWEKGIEKRLKGYLKSTCTEWLQKNDYYRSKTSLREVPPVVTMSSRAEADGMERHVCHIHGFYPREIDASWTRDGEIWEQDTLRGSVAPNSDGTYYYSLSIQIDPKERGRYRCHVEHDGLQQPLDVALKVTPVVTMSSRAEADGMERHVCQIHGFYPREIDASWTRDGEIWEQDTLRGSIAPNSDWTYYYSLSIQINPKERGRYRCHVEHDGLQQPLDVALKVPESSSSLGLIIAVSVAGLILVCAISGILAFLKFRRGEDDPRNDPSRTPPLNDQLRNNHLNLQQNSSESEMML